MSSFTDFAQTSVLEESMFMGWTQRELTELASQTVEGITRRSPRVINFMSKNKLMTVADVRFLINLASRVGSGEKSRPGDRDSFALNTGCRVETTLEATIVHRTTGDFDIFPHDITEFEGTKRSGEDVLFSAFSVLVLRGGKVVPQATNATWGDLYKRSELVDPSSVPGWADILQRLLVRDKQWSGKSDIERSSTTGPVWQSFLRSLLRRISIDDYWFCCHYLCTQIFRLVNPMGDRFNNSLAKAVSGKLSECILFVPLDPSKHTKPETIDAVKKVKASLPYAVNIPILTKYLTISSHVPSERTLKVAVQSVSLGTSWRGGDSGPLGLLTASFGWSIQTSEQIRRVSLSCAVINNLLLKHEQLDISMKSTGDLLLMHNTISTFCKLHKLTRDWKFIVPQATITSVDKMLRGYVSVSTRSSVMRFIWPEESYSAVNIEQISNYYTKVNDFIGSAPKSFVIWRPVMTEYWWKSERSQSKSFQGTEWTTDDRDFYVYSYGLPSEFQGFISTEPLDLSIIPIEPTKLGIIGQSMEKKPGTFIPAKLKLCDSSSSWYDLVAMANVQRNSAWITGLRRVTNLISGLVPPTKGIIWRFAEQTAFDGQTIEWAEDDSKDPQWIVVDTADGPVLQLGSPLSASSDTVDEEDDLEVALQGDIDTMSDNDIICALEVLEPYHDDVTVDFLAGLKAEIGTYDDGDNAVLDYSARLKHHQEHPELIGPTDFRSAAITELIRLRTYAALVKVKKDSSNSSMTVPKSDDPPLEKLVFLSGDTF